MTRLESEPTAAGEWRARWLPAALLGMAAGLLSGLFGVGGGILIVPGLVLLLGLQQRLAHGTSLAAILPIALSGVVGYGVHGLVDVRVAGLVATGAVLGAVGGSWLLARLPQRVLRLTFAGLLLATAVRLFVDLPAPTSAVDLTVSVAVAYAGTGLVVGVLSGLLGVGGGIFLVPALVLFFSMPDDLAKGTSLLVVIPTGLAATWRNVRAGNADLRTAALVGAAGAPSAFAGAQLAVVMSSRLSLALFAALLVVTALRLATKR